MKKFAQLTNFLSQNIFAQGLTIVISVFLPNVLSVNQLGIYNLSKSISGWFQYGHFGLRYFIDKHASSFTNNEYKKINSRILWLNGIVGIAIIILTFSFEGSLTIMFFLVSFLALSQLNLIRVYYRNSLNYDVYNRLGLKVSIINALATIIGVLFFNFKYFSFFLAVVNMFLFIQTNPFILSHVKNIKDIDYLSAMRVWFKSQMLGVLLLFDKKYFKYSSWIFFINLFLFFEDNLIQFLLGFHGNFEILGFFGVILLFPGLLFLIPSILIEFYYPKSYAGNFKQKITILKNHLGLLIIYVVFVLLISVYAMPIFVDFIFPTYSEIIPEIEYALYLIVPQALATPFYIFLLSINLHKHLLLVIFTVVVIFCFDIVINDMYEFFKISDYVYKKFFFKSLYFILLSCLTFYGIKNEIRKENHSL